MSDTKEASANVDVRPQAPARPTPPRRAFRGGFTGETPDDDVVEEAVVAAPSSQASSPGPSTPSPTPPVEAAPPARVVATARGGFTGAMADDDMSEDATPSAPSMPPTPAIATARGGFTGAFNTDVPEPDGETVEDTIPSASAAPVASTVSAATPGGSGSATDDPFRDVPRLPRAANGDVINPLEPTAAADGPEPVGAPETPPDAAEGAPAAPSGPPPVTDIGAEDPMQAYEHVDPLHASFMGMMLAPRDEARASVNETVARLLDRRNRLTAQADARTQADLEAAAAQRGGGRGSIFGGLGGLFRGDPTGKLNREIADIDQAIEQRTLFRKLVLDRQYKGMTDTADATYKAQKDLNSRVSSLNSEFSTSTEGKDYLASLSAVAAKERTTVEVIRDRIHDARECNPAVLALRAQASSLCSDPRWAGHVEGIEQAKASLEAVAPRFHDNVKRVSENGARHGLDMSPARGAEDLIGSMSVQDSLLARPGTRIDRMREQMKEMFEKIADTVRSIVESISRIFGAGPG